MAGKLCVPGRRDQSQGCREGDAVGLAYLLDLPVIGMRIPRIPRIPRTGQRPLWARVASGCVLAGAVLGLSACATTAPPKQFRTFFVPPVQPGSHVPAPQVID